MTMIKTASRDEDAPELVALRALASKGIFLVTLLMSLVDAVLARVSQNQAIPVLIVGLAASACLLLALRNPAGLSTRYTAVVALAIDMMLAIYATRGTPDGFDLEAHMLFFIFNAFIVFYFCWRSIVLYNVIVAAHHIAATIFLPYIAWPSDSYTYIHLGTHVALVSFQVPVLIFLSIYIRNLFNKFHQVQEEAAESGRMQAGELRTKIDEAVRDAETTRQLADQQREVSAQSQNAVVRSLADGLEKLSTGDLMFRLTTPFAPEYEKLRSDFNEAMVALQQTMTSIAGGVVGLRSGAQEIAKASDDLSQRTENQAASLEETAAALDEITAAVKKTASGANRTSAVVSEAKADAEHSGEVVREAVAAMGKIEKASQEIAQIIGVIDEIAFQTNLLALNAGVEAARAGDAGRGFAVVASEVRALAQRSAEAAKEIKTLISTSTVQVDAGVELVGETGRALARIVAQITQINAAVTEIAGSAQEQATGLHQVNTAVNQMDEVTQQNASMVEQSTSATHALAQGTEQLGHLVGRFGIGVAATAPSRPPPTQLPKKAAASRVALKTVSLSGRGGAAPQAKPATEAQGWEEF